MAKPSALGDLRKKTQLQARQRRRAQEDEESEEVISIVTLSDDEEDFKPAIQTKDKGKGKAIYAPDSDIEVMSSSSSAPAPKNSIKKKISKSSLSTAASPSNKRTSTPSPTTSKPGFLSSQGPPDYTETSDDDEDDLVEVELPPAGTSHVRHSRAKPIEITIGESSASNNYNKNGKKETEPRRRVATAEERAERVVIHKLHIVALLANAAGRNRLLCDDLLKARLLSRTPAHIIDSFSSITPSRVPDKAKRGRLFDRALIGLVEYWRNSFDIDWTLGVRYRSWDEVTKMSNDIKLKSSGNKKGKGREAGNIKEKYGGEELRSVKSLSKKVLQEACGRDTSAQIFVAQCRALGIPARLVVSLQPVSWRTASDSVNKSSRSNAPKEKGKARMMPDDVNTSDDENLQEVLLDDVPLPAPVSGLSQEPKKKMRWIDAQKLKDFPGSSNTLSGSAPPTISTPLPAPIYKMKKTKASKLGSFVPPNTPEEVFTSQSPPVFWAEVFSKPDQSWIIVDPVRGTVKTRKGFEPTTGVDRKLNRMLYVVGFEDDGTAKDLTIRYVADFVKTCKGRLNAKKGGDWWEQLIQGLGRNFQLARDHAEDAELSLKVKTQGMPQTLGGFHNHPLYVLERHLKREEVLHPKVQHSLFKGEPVYRRSNVVICKTTEGWMRVGRHIIDGSVPLKWVKQNASTINKRREIEAEKEAGEENAGLQGLYAEFQTSLYRPPPVENGIIPKNQYGNIDLFVPTMLPEGAVHLPYKGIGKIAKSLGMSFADACVGFEFKKRKAIPVLEGVVVPKGTEEALLEAWFEWSAEAAEREEARRRERSLKRWHRLITGLRIRARVQEDYGQNLAEAEENNGMAESGGFEADTGISGHHLPKSKHFTITMPEELPLGFEAPDEIVKQEPVVQNVKSNRNGPARKPAFVKLEDEDVDMSLLNQSDEDSDFEDDVEEIADPALRSKAANLVPKSLAAMMGHDDEESDSENEGDGLAKKVKKEPRRVVLYDEAAPSSAPFSPRLILRAPLSNNTTTSSTSGRTPRISLRVSSTSSLSSPKNSSRPLRNQSRKRIYEEADTSEDEEDTDGEEAYRGDDRSGSSEDEKAPASRRMSSRIKEEEPTSRRISLRNIK